MKHTQAIQKLRAAMQSNGLDAMLLHKWENVYYLSGFTGDEGCLWITAHRACMLVDSRFTEQAALECPDFETIQISQPYQLDACWDAETTVGIEAEAMSTADFFRLKKMYGNKIDFINGDDLLKNLRLFKEESEIDQIKAAVSLADRAFGYILPQLKPGVRERDIALEMEFFMRREGASGPSFDFIIAGGTRSSLPHGVASDAKLKNHEVVLMDFGCIYHHYCSDITRTVFIGQPDEEFKKLYQVVKDGQKLGLETSAPGQATSVVDRAVRQYFAGFGWDKQFGHSLGHGVGLEVHEAPALNSRESCTLEAGMVYTIEPGIYLPGKGGVRIEDMVLMTKDGPKVLTQAPKELIVL